MHSTISCSLTVDNCNYSGLGRAKFPESIACRDIFYIALLRTSPHHELLMILLHKDPQQIEKFSCIKTQRYRQRQASHDRAAAANATTQPQL